MEQASTARNRRTATLLGAAVLGMFGFGFAMVPLYGVICDITGIQSAQSAIAMEYAPELSQAGGERTVTVRFDATVHADLPWEFGPAVRSMEVPVGKMQQVHYNARNVSDRAVAGRAIPAVVPWQMSDHFSKADCFCFDYQELGPGEQREMPLAFWVSPDLPERVNSLTISYTFMQVEMAPTPDH